MMHFFNRQRKHGCDDVCLFFCLMMFSIKGEKMKNNDQSQRQRKRAKNNHPDPVQGIMRPSGPCLMSFSNKGTRTPPQKQNKGTQHFPHKPGVERTLKTSKSEQMWLAQRWHHVVCLWKKSHTCLMLGTCKKEERMCGAETVASACMDFICRRQCHSCHLLVLRGMKGERKAEEKANMWLRQK